MRVALERVSLARGGVPIIRGVSAVVSTGAFTCLMGPNGAGKTTLFGLMSGRETATDGRVLVDGVDVATVPRRDIARRFAILPQGVQDPPHVTVRELVSLARSRPGSGLRWRLRDVDRAAVESSMDRCGLGPLAGRTFTDLSGGEKQRAWLAFCLAQQKELIMLDESLASLDFATRREFFRLLGGLPEEGRGVVLVTHDFELAGRSASRLLVLNGGTVSYDGPPGPSLEALFAANAGAAGGG